MITRCLTLTLASLALGACAVSGGSRSPAPSYAMSGVLDSAMRGVSTIGLAVNSGVDPDPAIDAFAVENSIREAIIDHITQRGYTLAPPNRADRVIGYVAIVDYGAEDAVLFERLGVSPGVGAGQDVARGTIALFVMRPGRSEPLWRGAAQGALETRASARVRDERVTMAVQGLLADLPPAAQ